MTPTPGELIEREAERMSARTLAGFVRALVADTDTTQWEHGQRSRAFEAALKTRAAVDAGTTTDETWGGPLADLPGFSELISFVERDAVVAGLANRVPFGVPIPVVSSLPGVSWVGQAGGKPVAAGAFSPQKLTPFKVATIAVASSELMRFSSPTADAALTRILADAARRALNTTFLSDATAEADVSPAGALFGVTPALSTGLAEGELFGDLIDLLDGFERPVLIGSRALLIRVAAALGSAADLVRLQVAEEAGANLVAIDEARALVGFGGVNVLPSGAASIEMADDADGSATSTVSMFQSNTVALRVDAYASWWLPAGSVRALDFGLS